MDWSKEITRSNFVLELLVLAETGNANEMMDKLFEALVMNGEEILSYNNTTPKELESAFDQIIKWFADNERYEDCHELKQVKERCLK